MASKGELQLNEKEYGALYHKTIDCVGFLGDRFQLGEPLLDGYIAWKRPY